MPLVVFVLLALICLALLGFACACDQSATALERALQAPALAPLLEVWPVLAPAVVGTASMLIGIDRRARSRASPDQLQRFLF